MKTYTGWQYMLIDLANHFGLDKLLFEHRIEWAETNLGQLESLSEQAETKPLYKKAVLAIRKAQQGLPTGHMVGLDACCSGIQVLSVLSGCIKGATATGLVDPNKRADAYTFTTEVMSRILGSNLVVARADAKAALMTSFYGSKAEPKRIFGEDTPELDAFYEAAQSVSPGAWELLQDLLASWKPYALEHSWKMPDGFDVRVKVMTKKEVRIEVDELNHSTFTYEYYENKGQRFGLSNAANVTHSVDAYILRCMHRRCNYDLQVMEHAAGVIEAELIRRMLGGSRDAGILDLGTKVGYYAEQYVRSTMPDVVILPYLDDFTVQGLDQVHLKALSRIVNKMLEYPPFALVTVHDEFKAHPNHMNHVRWLYREILAELAESFVLDDLLTQLNGRPGVFPKMTYDLADHIRGSEYALC